MMKKILVMRETSKNYGNTSFKQKQELETSRNFRKS